MMFVLGVLYRKDRNLLDLLGIKSPESRSCTSYAIIPNRFLMTSILKVFKGPPQWGISVKKGFRD